MAKVSEYNYLIITAIFKSFSTNNYENILTNNL